MGVTGKIFISYRRRQSLAEAQHLATILAKEFGARRIFIDVRGIDGFSDWFDTLKQQVEGTAAMISVVGKDWLSALDAKDHPPGETTKDFVRFEIAEALRRNVPVLPVLLDGAAMPLPGQLPPEMQGLLRRQGMKIRGEEFPQDAAAVARQLKKLLAEMETGKGVAPWKVVALSAAVFALGVAAGPAILTRAGFIPLVSSEEMPAALKEAQRQAKEAEARLEAGLRETSRASAEKDAAVKEARASSALAATEKSRREAAETEQKAALGERDKAVAAKEAAEKEARDANALAAAAEKSRREAAEAKSKTAVGDPKREQPPSQELPKGFSAASAKRALQGDAGALMGFGVWSSTPQGHEYWTKLHARLVAGEKLPRDAREALESWIAASEKEAPAR
jgi:hypothetical protein